MTDVHWDADDYSRNSQLQSGWAGELLGKLALQGDERILDLGCGDGRTTAILAARLPAGSAVGIDSSAEMIALAREHFPAESHPTLRFQLADAGSLPFAGAFDVVFSNAALHWVLDHRPLLAGIRRALVPGGRLLLQMGGEGQRHCRRCGRPVAPRGHRLGALFRGLFLPVRLLRARGIPPVACRGRTRGAARRTHPQRSGSPEPRSIRGVDSHHLASLHTTPARRPQSCVRLGPRRHLPVSPSGGHGGPVPRRDGAARGRGMAPAGG